MGIMFLVVLLSVVIGMLCDIERRSAKVGSYDEFDFSELDDELAAIERFNIKLEELNKKF